MARRLFVFAVIVALCAAAACGKKSRRTGPWLGEHRGDGPGANAGGDRTIPKLGLDKAGAGLADAIAANKRFDIVVYANRLVSAGGTLDRDKREAIDKAIDEMSESVLRRAWGELDEVAPADMVALRRALIARHRGDEDEALEWLSLIPDRSRASVRAKALRKAINAGSTVDRSVVAVLLPITGPYSRLGVEIAAAVELAAREDEGVKLEFIDTRGETGGALEAVDKAVFVHHAVAILGPVGAHESRAAASRAAELGIPIALLSPEHYGAAPAAGIVRLWSSPEWEARQAVHIATRMGYDRLAVLVPRDEQGLAQSEAFRAAAREAGVTVVAYGDYDPTATNLEPDLKLFLGLDPKTNRRLRRHLARRGYKKGWKTFSPSVEFDLLFVPDDYQRAALVAAYLPFFNVEVRSQDVMDIAYLKKKHGGRVPQVVQLVGSSGWHHPSLIPRGGSVLEGALLVDVYAGGETEEFSTEEAAVFAEAFRARNRRWPTAVAAQAHDATLLVLAARAAVARSQGRKPREVFIRELGRVRIADGVCGPAAVGKDGEIIREAILLRIDGGAFVAEEY